MGAKRKYPLWPGPKDDEVPYDTEHFKRWLVNSQGLTISTAKAYVSSIRTAFSVMFAEDDATFKNLRNAFRSQNHLDPERRVARLEAEHERLEEYIWAVNEFGDITLDEFNSNLHYGQEKKAPKEMWVTALQAYSRYIRWRIDLERVTYDMKINVEDNTMTFIEVPFSKEFIQYLKNKGIGYKKKSIETYLSKLKRIYNLLFRRLLGDEAAQSLYQCINQGIAPESVCDVLTDIVNQEIEDPLYPDLSHDDLSRGIRTLELYREFLKDYVENPGKYPSEKYEIPMPDED